MGLKIRVPVMPRDDCLSDTQSQIFQSGKFVITREWHFHGFDVSTSLENSSLLPCHQEGVLKRRSAVTFRREKFLPHGKSAEMELISEFDGSVQLLIVGVPGIPFEVITYLWPQYIYMELYIYLCVYKYYLK